MPQAILFVRRSTNSIYEQCLQQYEPEKLKILICGGLNDGRSPPHPP